MSEETALRQAKASLIVHGEVDSYARTTCDKAIVVIDRLIQRIRKERLDNASLS